MPADEMSNDFQQQVLSELKQINQQMDQFNQRLDRLEDV